MHSKLTHLIGITGLRTVRAFVAVGALVFAGIPQSVYALSEGSAQTVDSGPVTGIVLDSSGEPVIGATVMLKGTTTGVVTDADGRFSIKAHNGSEIVVSYIGYSPQTIKLTPSNRNLTVRLNQSMTNLDEVVVVGYGTMKKRDLIGAVDKVDSKVLAERSNTSVTRALQGAIPNLNITMPDGKPTHNGSVNVRGTGSIGSKGSALVLVDGVEGDMNMVNPQDVASVTVLKDASSTAIYGARGAFGVILITTKNAQKGDAKVTYSGSVSRRSRTVEPELVTNGYEWNKGYMLAWDNYYNGSNPYNSKINNNVPFSMEWVEELERRNNDPSLEKVRVNDNGVYEYFANTDWTKEFYKDHNLSTEHNLSISGGTQKANYYVSGRYYGQDGIYRVGNEKFNQYNIRAKGNLQVKNWLKIGNNMDMHVTDYHQPMLYYSLQIPQRMIEHSAQPLMPLRNPDGTWTRAAVNCGYAGFYDGTSYQDEKKISLTEKFNAEVNIIKDVLKLSGDAAYRIIRTNRNRVTNMYTGYTAPDVFEIVNQSQGSTLENYRGDTDYWATNLYANFTPELRGGNDLNVLVGWNVESRTYRNQTVKREGLTMPEKPSFGLMDGVTDDPKAGGNDWSYAGVFFRVNYSFRDRYLLEVSGRYDGSSKFPENSKWGFFPSASIGWRVNEEKFMESTRGWLTNLKIRASIGSMGNGNIDPYQYIDYMKINTSSVLIGDALGAYTSVPGTIPLSLTWEKSTTYDIGLDMDVFNGRLGFGFDWYRRNTTDMYTAGMSLPAVFGASAPKGNNASLRTDGWELSLSWKDSFMLGGRPFSYGVKGMVWDAKSVVTKYINPNGNLSDYYEGMELGEIWGFKVEGLFRDQEDIDSHAVQTFLSSSDKISRPGTLKFADLNQDGVIDFGDKTLNNPGDRCIIGNATPRYMYGINLNANYAGVGISAFFQGVGKRDWYPRYDSGYFWGQYNRPFGYMLKEHTGDNVYREELDNWETAYWPRYTAYQAHEDKDTRTLRNANDRFLQNASYLRLKTLTVDYVFPKKIINALRLSDLRVWFSGENLVTWTPLRKHAPNYDPEVITSGDSDFRNEGDGYSYPMQRVLTFGLNFTF